MKKLIFLSLLLFTLISATSDKVYICTGKYAKAYHVSMSCRGVNACRSDINTITLSEAQNMGRTTCGYCCK